MTKTKTPKYLFAVPCKYGRGGFGATSGSVGVKVGEKSLSIERRGMFIGTTLDVLLSLDPEPTSRPLASMEDAFGQHRVTVTARTISINEQEVGFTLKFAKDAMPGEFLKELAGQNGSLIVLEKLADDTELDDDEDDDDADDE